MKINIDKNGWTVIVDEDIRTLSEEDIKDICRLTVKHMVVVFKKQNLTPEEQLKFCSVIGNYQPTPSERAKHIVLINGVLRVTGQKNAYGEPGLFGHKAALDWHCNQASNENRHPLIWLYGAEGTAGSRTSWLNNIESYKDLPEDLKNRIKDIKIYCGYKTGSYSDSKHFKEHVNEENPIPLVYTNKEGITGLYFPFLQTFGFEGYEQEEFEEIKDLLTQHILQEKYMYHHDWEDGDVVLSEQWLSIHKRWDFEGMEQRVLHRIAFDYSNVYK